MLTWLRAEMTRASVWRTGTTTLLHAKRIGTWMRKKSAAHAKKLQLALDRLDKRCYSIHILKQQERNTCKAQQLTQQQLLQTHALRHTQMRALTTTALQHFGNLTQATSTCKLTGAV